MERMPCGQFAANAVFFRMGVLAYNLFLGFKAWVLQPSWRKRQVQMIRWQLYQTAGKIVRHAGQLYLKLATDNLALFNDIRQRCWSPSISGGT